jgi:hypothetical protein
LHSTLRGKRNQSKPRRVLLGSIKPRAKKIIADKSPNGGAPRFL